MTSLFDLLARDRFLPLLVGDGPADVGPLLDSMAASGAGLAEIGLRSDGALAVIRAVARRSDILVGAGTVVTRAQVDAVVDAGAAFVVSPGFRSDVVERCLELGIDVLPGVATAGDVMGAVGLGLDTVKLFPAALLGGPAMADALAGPFPHVRLVPSGGVTPQSAAAYLERPNVLAVSGRWGSR